MTTQHTPTPWHTGRINPLSPHIGYVDDAGGDEIALLASGYEDERDRANAAFIVLACNAHAELVAALEAVLGHGYSESKRPASQDYVSKGAIALCRSVLVRAKVQP